MEISHAGSSKKTARYAVQPPLTSLIDIVFLLLIYFLLTTNFMVDEGINIKLPQAQAAKPQTQREITVYVDTEGKAFLENKEMALNELFEPLEGTDRGTGGPPGGDQSRPRGYPEQGG